MRSLKAWLGIISAFLAVVTGYIGLGGPLPATNKDMRVIECQLLKVRVHVGKVDLFQWEHNNPEPRTREVLEAIADLKQHLADLAQRLLKLDC